MTNDAVLAGAWTVDRGALWPGCPKKPATAAVEFIHGSLTDDPRQAGKPLKLGLAGLHSARRGDYRVIYLINDDLRTVTITAIEHRSDLYRPGQL